MHTHVCAMMLKKYNDSFSFVSPSKIWRIFVRNSPEEFPLIKPYVSNANNSDKFHSTTLC